MKKQLKKALAILCALAFAVTGITYTPAPVSAADEGWFDAVLDTDRHWTDVNSEGDGQGLWSYGGNPNYKAQYTDAGNLEGFKWNTTQAGEAIWFKTRDLKTVKCVSQNGELVKPTPGVKYTLKMKFTYANTNTTSTATTSIKTWGKDVNDDGDGGTNDFQEYKQVGHNDSLEVSTDIIMSTDENLHYVVEFALNVKKNSWSGYDNHWQKGTVTVSEFSLVRADDFEPVTPNVEGGFNPDGTPWYLSVAYNGDDTSLPENQRSWGKMSYKVDGTASNISSTYMRTDNAAHDDSNLITNAYKEKIQNQNPGHDQAYWDEYWANFTEEDAFKDPNAWWWWNGAKIKDYMTTSGLIKGKKYIGTFKFNYTSSNTSYSPKLRMIINGEVKIINVQDGDNTLTIGGTKGFLYNGVNKDVEFNLDLLENDGVFRVTELSFVPADDFMPVPANVENGYNPTNTPWYLSVQNDAGTTWGALSYKLDQQVSASDVSSTYIRVDNPAHDDSNLKTDELLARKKANDKDPEHDAAYWADYWSKYTEEDAFNDADAWWWWNSAKLTNYLQKQNLKVGKKYVGTLKFNYTSSNSGYTPKLRMIVNGEIKIIDVVDGENTVAIGGKSGFKYTGQYKDVEFNLDLLEADSIFRITQLSFETDSFEPVTPNVEGGFVPEGTPWHINVQNNGSSMWGEMSYSVSGTASEVASTTLRVDNPAHDDSNLITDAYKAKVEANNPDHDEAYWEEYWSNFTEEDALKDPDAWWWWNSAKLPNYLKDRLEDGRSYTAVMTVNYTAPIEPEEEYTPQLRIIMNGEVKIVTLTDGENTIAFEQFDYMDTYPDLEFNFDLLEKGSSFQLVDTQFTQVGGNWKRVPDNEEEGVTIPVTYDSSVHAGETVTHNWNLFAGIWEGHGAAIYYDNVIEDYSDPLKIKIGAGERWDPACAQVKLTDLDAYQELEDYTNYYMTYTFTSTEKGTLHINQEGYPPNKLERVDITDDDYNEEDGLYHVTFKKIFTNIPEKNEDANLVMFLTPTTYVYNQETQKVEVKMDGEYLPAGTILANHKIEYSRQDKDGWTLVTDSRDESVQKYDDIVVDENQKPLIQAYANSFGYSQARYAEFDNGRMSYLKNQNPDGKDEISQTGFRLDSTGYTNGDDDYEFDNQWANHLRIPNDYFYGRKDTNGNELVDGQTYTLRFFINTTQGTVDGKGLILVRQGYDWNKWYRYPVSQGLNLINGTVESKKKNAASQREPYTVYTDYKKTGGIEFIYNESATTDEDFVQFDFSEFPAGTIINGIEWEFEAPGYNVYIDGSKNPDNEDPIVEGDTYKFPETPGVIGYRDNYDPNKIYTPGQEVPFSEFTDDIYVTSITGYTVKIVDTQGNELRKTTLDPGDSYTFPTSTEQGFTNYKEYTNPTATYEPGDKINSVNEDLVFTAIPYGQYAVTVIHRDSQEELDVDTVDEGGTYTFPTIQGIKDYTYNNQTYNPGQTLGPILSDTEVIGNPVEQYTATIVNSKTQEQLKQDPVNDDGTYKIPAIDGIKEYTYGGQTYHAGDTITGITGNITIQAVPYETYTIKIDGDVVATVREGGEYTFPSGPDAANIGYINVNGGPVLDPGTTIKPINENRDYLSINSIDIIKMPGASMWFKQGQDGEDNLRGIGFGANFAIKNQKNEIINKNDYAKVYASDAFKLGTIITTYDFYTEYFDGELNLEKYEQNKEYAKNIMNDHTFCDPEGVGVSKYAGYRAAIAKMSDANITRDFIARSYGYVETANGTVTDVVYAQISDKRSIKQVATNIKAANDGYYDSLDAWKQEIVNYCAAYEN